MDFYIVSAEENLGKIPEYLTLSGCANPPDFEVWLFYQYQETNFAVMRAYPGFL